MVNFCFYALVCLGIFVDLVSSNEEDTETIPSDVIEKVEAWPDDLEPSAQIIFRPLFVTRQRQAAKAALSKERRRKIDAESTIELKKEVRGPEKVTKTVTWYLTPPTPSSFQEPYYAYYQPHGQWYYSPSRYYYKPNKYLYDTNRYYSSPSWYYYPYRQSKSRDPPKTV